jgi:hypothetical protein
MKRTQGCGSLILGLAIVATAMATSAHAQTNRLSLNPYAVVVAGGATLVLSGFDAPLRLPNAGNPNFGTGFTIPNDYLPNGTLKVQILWETPSTGCDFHLLPNLLFRARTGQPRDFGNAVGGLSAVNASTPFTLSGGGGIIMAAPATAHETARVRFNIVPDNDFPTLQPGDAINFGFYRQSASVNDTCTGDLGIAGFSIVYPTS